ncbi:MAG: hypothetical protein WCS65_17215 [Verrucomicrobiae bacterium]
MESAAATRKQEALHIWALITLAATVFLLYPGGSCSSHPRRCFAACAAIIILAAWLMAADSRRWVKRLGLAAATLAACLCWLPGAPPITVGMEILRDLLAQASLCAAGILAAATSQRFRRGDWDIFCPDSVLKNVALATTAILFLQPALDAAMLGGAGAAMAFLGAAAAFYRAARRTRLRSAKAWSSAWLALLVIQAGFFAWPTWFGNAAGSLATALGAIFSFRLIRGGQARRFWLPESARNSRAA